MAARTVRTWLLVVASVLALAACGQEQTPPQAQPSGTGQLGEAPTTTPAAATQPPTSAPPTTEPPTQTTGAPTAGPHIVYFRVAADPACPSSTPDFQFPGSPVKLEWKVAGGATGASLSIDGPGLWDSYGVEGSAELPFSCSGQTNTYQTHTYTLSTVGGGPAASQTLPVQALIHDN